MFAILAISVPFACFAVFGVVALTFCDVAFGPIPGTAVAEGRARPSNGPRLPETSAIPAQHRRRAGLRPGRLPQKTSLRLPARRFPRGSVGLNRFFGRVRRVRSRKKTEVLPSGLRRLPFDLVERDGQSECFDRPPQRNHSARRRTAMKSLLLKTAIVLVVAITGSGWSGENRLRPIPLADSTTTSTSARRSTALMTITPATWSRTAIITTTCPAITTFTATFIRNAFRAAARPTGATPVH